MDQSSQETRFDFDAIGTRWRIVLHPKFDRPQKARLLYAIKARIELFDKAYSRFREDSLVTKMSRETGVFELPSDAEPMLSLYLELYRRTGGLVTPLVGNLLSDAGYDARYSLRQKKELEVPPSWDEALDYKQPLLTIKRPVLLDFGAAGKGYLVDLVARVLELNDIQEYYIDAGGDILHKSKRPIRVGLEDPINTKQVLGVCMLGTGAIAGSAHNRRAWQNFTHIMNPKTLVSPTDIAAIWVTAETAMLADALATCLFFVPPHTLAPAYDFEYLIVRSDRSFERSAGFPGEIFTQSSALE
ncbi:FAD:protein FMN transferase [Patescibacteria group bacterium]|nr:FAD:protein FMN transferase [Patescibacteria group bacterium]MDE1946948.1 FAD:protein FMN transferase [Patescibacteria group bacterium]MDE2011209.1 FAD:protein FMN transferase [Patescibacteria group bacterium]MDE2233499.1 FAD:protein FMN transferase [Patescibacteria group bacterium]